MHHQEFANDTRTDEIQLGELVGALWANRLLIIGTILLFIAAALAYLNVATYRYTAELKVTPSESSGGGSPSASGLAGLASIAGISLGQESGATPFQLYLEGIKSRNAAEVLVQRLDIAKVVFKAEWSEERQRFIDRPNAIGNTIRDLKGALGLPIYPWQEPGAARMQAFIQDNVTITENPKSPVVTLAFSHADQKFASRFLDVLHQVVDEQLRRKALQRSGRYISYLNTQLQRVTVAEHRQALTQALSEQEKFRMMASSGLAYAADPFGEAASSLHPTSPQPAITIFLSATLGFACGALIVLIRWWRRGGRR